MDWERDDVLAVWIETADWRRRYESVVLALWRLRAPLLHIEMPREWGVSCDVLEALFAASISASGDLDDRIRSLLAELQTAPLFSSEADPGLTQWVQLEAIGALLSLGDGVRELEASTIERIVSTPRGMGHYLDQIIAESLTLDPLESEHQRYLSELDDRIRVYKLGYYGARNLEVEFACRDVVSSRLEDRAFFTHELGQRLLNLCEAFGAEFVAALRQT